MVNSNINFRVVILPVLVLLAKEILWNISVFFVNPLILNIPTQLLLVLIYLSTGFIADSIFGYDTFESAIYGAITGVIGSILGGVIVSPLFYRMLFYSPGIPVFTAIYNIASSGVQGGILGFIGSLLTSVDQLDFISNIVVSIDDEFWKSINEITGKKVDVKPPQTAETGSLSPMTRDPKGIATNVRSLAEFDEYEKRIVREAHPDEELDPDYELTLDDLQIIYGYREEIEQMIIDASSDDGELYFLGQLSEDKMRIVREAHPGEELDPDYELTEEDRRRVHEYEEMIERMAQGTPSPDDLGYYPELTEKEIRAIVEEHVAAQTDSYEAEILVEKTEEANISAHTQAALKEVYKESEKAKSSGIINGIRRFFQKRSK